MSDFETHQFGFRWGPMWVHRILSIKNKGRLISVKADTTTLEVWVSEKGKSVRVWKNGKELK